MSDTTFDMLMEDLSEAYRDYTFNALLEDVSVSDPDEKVKKDNAFKRFCNAVARIFKFIWQKLKEFATKVGKYISTFKNDTVILGRNYTVSHEVMTGTSATTTKMVIEMGKLLGKAETRDEDEYTIQKCRDSMNELFKSKTYTFKKGTPVKLNIIQRNLLASANDAEKAEANLNKYLAKFEHAKEGSNKARIMNEITQALSNYRDYLTRIMNETAKFVQDVKADASTKTPNN